MPLPKQLGLISNSKTINTCEPLPLNGQPPIRAVKTNSMHELTSSKSAALQVAYFSPRATNTTLSSYKSTHSLATTSPFTCPFLCFFPIASHRSLIRRQTWPGSSQWLTACGNKNKLEKPCFTSLFSSLEAPKQSQEHSPFAAANLSLVRPTHSFLVHSAQLSSVFFGAEREHRPALPEIICSSYPHLG